MNGYSPRVYGPIARSPYGPMQTPFADDMGITPVCLGPTSKLIGAPLRLHGNGAQAWGAFPSEYCNATDIWVGCRPGAGGAGPARECPSYGPRPDQPCVTCRDSAEADRILAPVPISAYNATGAGGVAVSRNIETRYPPHGVLP
jgi:hypothetical protein